MECDSEGSPCLEHAFTFWKGASNVYVTSVKLFLCVSQCYIQLLGNQLMALTSGILKRFREWKNHKKKTLCTFQFQLILFPSWKKRKTNKKTTICTEVWEAVIDPNIGWFWAINIKWYWHDWTKHDHTQHIAQMKKEKRTIEKMSQR